MFPHLGEAVEDNLAVVLKLIALRMNWTTIDHVARRQPNDFHGRQKLAMSLVIESDVLIDIQMSVDYMAFIEILLWLCSLPTFL